MKISIGRIIRDIQDNLTPDLLSKQYAESKRPFEGHCYIATETLYHILQSIPQYRGKYKPFVLTHKQWPKSLDPGETHWYLMSNELDVLDVTAPQFKMPFEEIPHWEGRSNGMMNHPVGGSKRSKILRKRILDSIK